MGTEVRWDTEDELIWDVLTIQVKGVWMRNDLYTFTGLGMRLRTSSMLGKHFTTE